MKSLTHGLRVEILSILNERIASPNELAKELGEGLSQVSYHVKVLRDNNCIELVKTEPRRGAVEHYYRATSRAFLTDRDWAALPASVRPGLSADLLQLIVDDAVAALEAETFDRRVDRHMSRTLMVLDEPGWEELTSLLEGTLDEILAIQKRANSRLAKTDGKGVPVAAQMLGFEMPEGASRKRTPRRKSKAKASATE
ncbi:MAG TPA: winged helix-turn-helix domain-containing protein [Solirubrobacterales bacterium]